MKNNKQRLVMTCLITVIGMIGSFYIHPASTEAGVFLQASTSSEQNNDLLPLIWTVVIVGGCIGVTLTYVSWRKYRGESKKETKTKTKQDKTVD
ncbi:MULTISPECIES: sporulation protein YpjB [Virgibacillus]|uniref:sporulation protein YpjB n=1 Tax=Virgibacillus TaxID=84406 RepID=UPI0003884ACB|nr:MULTISPECIES: sporulation protein YpjB [Virgibacillus]EQB36124.1 hypothetical protein M948_13895 [Virgibacillus sp. CM-4]MYL41990.1 hypothetical protein [Virgibacillus massiliensis]